MELKPGDKLGAYEIVSLLGKGGMGEVWKARDPQVGRDLAIKVSAQQFTDRFEREVRAIGALNHANICTLYHVGPNYLVMELVEGPTLAERIKASPIPLGEALGYARQIADALEAAHEKGIVHRDLKPANVKVRPDGSVKVLDFGLAKAGETHEVTPDSPTMMPGTQMGMILGTAGYMSPEQARGKEVDKRADIWAFGVVLYEMVTRKRLFEGETVSDTLAAVLKEEPDLDLAPEKTRLLLRRCLEKDPKRRLRDIGDAMALLDTELASAAPLRSRFGKTMWVAGVAIPTMLLAALAFVHFREKPVGRPPIRLDVDLGADVSLPVPDPAGRSLSISPDGTRLVYEASTPGHPERLFLRKLDQPAATELPGTEGAVGPFFSPDGQFVGFSARNKYYKISVDGGDLVPLSDSVANTTNASWGEDGRIVITEVLKGLSMIPASGGALTPVTRLEPGHFNHAFPEILPGGKAVLFADFKLPTPDRAIIDVVSLPERRQKVLIPAATSPRYSASGHLLYAKGAELFAIPFDLKRLEVRGAGVPVLDDVAILATQSGSGEYDISRTGTLVYRKRTGAGSGIMTVQWLDAAGRKEPLAAKPGTYQWPRLSPDGKRLALAVLQGTNDIWVYEWQRDTMIKLTFGGQAVYRAPVWSPDGRYILFGAQSGEIYWTRADGSGQPQALTKTETVQIPYSFTPDGKRLAFIEVGSSVGVTQIWTAPIEDDGGQLKAGKPEQFLKNPFTDLSPMFSPDGHWLAYQSNESGRYEVYVRAFPQPASGEGGKWVISTNGGTNPVWSRTNHELLYQAGDQIMAVSYAVNHVVNQNVQGDSFAADKPRMWSAKAAGTGGYDLTPDGKRLLVLTPVDSGEAPRQEHEVVLFLNFFDELRRRVPANK